MTSTIKMRVSEVYASAQGEGPKVGKTTVFVRFGGCNLRCPGWPCDTQHAIQPEFRNEWEQHSVEELIERTIKTAELVGTTHITLTGGEPFLQPKRPLQEYVKALTSAGYDLEAFSNGTIAYPEWAIEKISFIMDWKLPGSGEDPNNTTRLYNLKLLGHAVGYSRQFKGIKPNQSIKFVIKDGQDLQAAHGLWFEHVLKAGLSKLETFYGKVWDSEIEDKDLVAYVMENGLPWRLNRQVHNYIWPPNERGR